jgi:phosphotransferase system HPr-like phosphotransfer protein
MITEKEVMGMMSAMMSAMIYLNSFDKIKNFVDITNQLDCDIDLVSGRYVIDAKSIMGIFSLDLSKPIEIKIMNSKGDTKDFPKELEEFLI